MKNEILKGVLNDSYNLALNTPVGDRSYYRLSCAYNDLNEIGVVESVNEIRGRLERVVKGIRPDGGREEHVTWDQIEFIMQPDMTKPALAPIPLEFGNGWSYDFCAEKDYEDFDWKTDGIPKDGIGWNFLLLTIDAHFEFDFIHSRFHGAIDKRTRIGDGGLIPDNGKAFDILLDPAISDCTFIRNEFRNEFLGLAVKDGQECAILGFDLGVSPFYMEVKGLDPTEVNPELIHLDMSSTFTGKVYIRLSDGALQYGEFTELVLNENKKANTHARIRVKYTLNREEE